MLDLSNFLTCPKCSHDFEPTRPSQKFCSRACQKATTQNASRGNRSEENSKRSWRHYERADRLFEMVYSAPPQERLGVMKHILEFIPVDAGLRNILTDPKLHLAMPRKDGRKNIAKAANAFTQRSFGLSIKTYVTKVKAGEEVEGISTTSPEAHMSPSA